MLYKSFITEADNYAALTLRLVLGIMLLPHGMQKLFGVFGGYGFEGTTEYFTGTLGIPYIVVILIITLETLGALGLIFGFLTRFTAISTLLFFISAIFIAHLQYGFFMNWSGNQQGEGIEFHLLAIGISLSLVMMGGGALSIDSLISKCFKK